ncbi:hypothetical protein DXG01_001818, partial [Tephrocybe rancida]
VNGNDVILGRGGRRATISKTHDSTFPDQSLLTNTRSAATTPDNSIFATTSIPPLVGWVTAPD